jgi:hypothetical protein
MKREEIFTRTSMASLRLLLAEIPVQMKTSPV